MTRSPAPTPSAPTSGPASSTPSPAPAPTPSLAATSPAPAPAAAGYAGDVTPAEAWRLANAGDAVIVDVRTPDEWYWVGRVPGAEQIAWATGRDQARNDRFVDELEARVPKSKRVLFLCRSGARSLAAAKAATAAGYPSAWNIEGGFEGPLDDRHQRNRLAGWRAADLPWEQG